MQIINNGPFVINCWYDDMKGDCIELIDSNKVSDTNPTGIIFAWNYRFGVEVKGIRIPTKLQGNKDYVLQEIEDYISENL